MNPVNTYHFVQISYNITMYRIPLVDDINTIEKANQKARKLFAIKIAKKRRKFMKKDI